MFRSNRHIYAQVISDETGRTLGGGVDADAFDGEQTGNKAAAAQGRRAHRRALPERNITEVVFDRNGFCIHGRIKEVADGARAAGLKF